MEVNLTAGAITKMSNGEVTSEKEMTPVLQVTELKLVQTKIQKPNQNPESSKERYKLVLSDGVLLLQGMLNASLNSLVEEGIIQLGSVIRLTQYVCSLIQSRRFVIVVNVDIIADKWDIIRIPRQAGKSNEPGQSSIDQPYGEAASVNTQSIGGCEQQEARTELNAGRFADLPQPQVPDTGRYSVSANSPQPQIPDAGRYGLTANLPQPQVGQRFGTGSGIPETSPSTRPYVSSNAGYGGSGQEQPRAPVPVTNAYSRPVQSGYQPQQPPMYVNSRGSGARNEAPPRIIPIAALNPYQGRWTIKVRVTSKGELRRFNNPRGEGKVFSFDLLDADGGEIRVTCFNDVVDQFFDLIVVGNVYLISRGSLKPARKDYNHLPNDYEIHLDSASTIKQCYDDDAAIPRNQFHFRNIGDIENMESNSVIDLIGIVSSISPTLSVMRKNGSEVQKRSLQLKDMSGRSIELTMWGDFCKAEGQKLQDLCDSGVYSVLAVKAVRIGEFNGKQVSTIGSSQLFIEPDFPEGRQLRNWYEREGRNAPFVSISRESGVGRQDVRKVITQIKDEKLGTSEKPDWITVTATISFMKTDSFCYTACPIMNGERPCSKKVTNNGDGTWRCEKCDKCVDECDYRYILQIQLQDHTGLTWATAFQEAGEEIMGVSAKDLYYVKYEHQDDEKFEEIIRNVTFKKYTFKLKIKEETYSDEQRVKATVVKAEKLNYSSNTKFMLEAMDKLRKGDASSHPTVKPESSNYRSDAFNSGIGTSEARETGSVDARREFGLPAANQASQYGNQYSSNSRPLGGITSCNACGSNAHVSANCPSVMSEPQGQYMNGTPGRYTGGGMPRQHVGGY